MVGSTLRFMAKTEKKSGICQKIPMKNELTFLFSDKKHLLNFQKPVHFFFSRNVNFPLPLFFTLTLKYDQKISKFLKNGGRKEVKATKVRTV